MRFDRPKQGDTHRPSPTYTPKPGVAGPDQIAGGGKRGGGRGPKDLSLTMSGRLDAGNRNAPRASSFTRGDAAPTRPIGKPIDQGGELRNKDLPNATVLGPDGKRRAPNAQEQTSSHVDPNSTRRKVTPADMTAKDWMQPKTTDRHTGKPTKRAVFESDNPINATRGMTDIRDAPSSQFAGGGRMPPPPRAMGPVARGGWENSTDQRDLAAQQMRDHFARNAKPGK